MKKERINYKIAIIIILFILGFILRFWNLPQQLFFGPEQGIDTLVVKSVVEDGKARLIGPKTDIDGVFHGPHFYYLSAIPYVLSGGHPLVLAAWSILFSSAAIVLIFLLTRSLFTEKTAILAALFYAVSYGAIVYSRWLSTHAFAPFFMLLSLHLFLMARKKKLLLPLSLFFAAFTAQLEILNTLYLIPLFTILIFAYRKKFSPLNIIFSLLVAALSFSNFLFFDLRHQFLITNRVIAVLQGEAGFSTDFISALKVTLLIYLNEGAFYLFPINFFWGRIIFLALLFWLFLNLFKKSKKRKEEISLFLWLLIPLVILGFTRQPAMSQFFVILGPAFIILFAYGLDAFFKKINKRWLFFSLPFFLILTQMIAFKNFLPKNRLVFFQAPQPDLRFGDQISAIDYVYKDAGDKKFSFVAYTIPYWMDQGWQYLFDWYGQKNYGYIPQRGEGGSFYIIWQKDYNNLSYQNDWFVKMDQKSQVLSEKKFGEVNIQKRLNTENKK